jgi:hypothetical protein
VEEALSELRGVSQVFCNPDACRFCWRIDNSKLGLRESIPETLVTGNPSIIQRQRLAGNFLAELHCGYTI